MPNDITFSQLNPLSSVSIGKFSTYGSILLVIFIAFLILGLIGFFAWYYARKKQYWIIIKVYRKIGNIPTLVAVYRAKEVPFGLAGDKLWKVSSGFMFLKTVKWLPVGRIQSAPREFWYWIREDGEWINFQMDDLDEISKKAGVKFTYEDMKMQRLATEKLLQQRFSEKSFWEKWQTTIMTLLVFLIVGISVAIIFFQWGKLLDKMIPLVEGITKSLELTERYCQMAYNSTQGGYNSLIPVR